MPRQLLLHPLDANGKEILDLGTPTAATSATHVDAVSVPLTASGVGSPGSSFLAAPADHVHPAAGGGGGTNIGSIEDNSERYAIGSSEVWVAEYLVDFSVLQATLTPVINAFTKQDDGLAGGYFVRMGGTPGVADGTILVTLSTTHSSYPGTPDSATGSTFSNPGGKQLVKVSAHGSSISSKARIRNALIEIS